jgi:serine/threonine protein kinase
MDFGPRFRIEELLVYKAFDKELSRTVVLKTLPPERVKRELLRDSKISHRNILLTRESSDVNDVKFIRMAFIEGGDLNQLLKEEGHSPLSGLSISLGSCAKHSKPPIPRVWFIATSSRIQALSIETAERCAELLDRPIRED